MSRAKQTARRPRDKPGRPPPSFPYWEVRQAEDSTARFRVAKVEIRRSELEYPALMYKRVRWVRMRISTLASPQRAGNLPVDQMRLRPRSWGCRHEQVLRRLLIFSTIVLLSPLPTAEASFLQAGVDAARTGLSLSPGPSWGDLAFNFQLPGNGSTLSPPLIVNGQIYVATNPFPGDEENGFNGVYRIDPATTRASPFIEIPPWPMGEGPLAEDPAYRTALVSDGTHLFVSHNLGVDAFRLSDASLAWTWKPSGGPWDTLDHLYCPTPAHRDGVLFVACEWHKALPAGPDYDYQHRLVANALDAKTGIPVWPTQWEKAPSPVSEPNPVSSAASRKVFMGPISAVDSLVVLTLQNYTDVYGPQDSEILALNAQTGALRWTGGQPVDETFRRHWPPSLQWGLAQWSLTKQKQHGAFWASLTPTAGADGYIFHDHHTLDRILASNGAVAERRYLNSTTFEPDRGAGLGIADGYLYAASADILYRFDLRSWEQSKIHTLPSTQSWARNGFVIDRGILYGLADQWNDANIGEERRILSTSMLAIDLVERDLIWSHPIPAEDPKDTSYWPGGRQAMAVAEDLAAIVGRSGNVTILGTTPVSIRIAATASNHYPALLETVTVDLGGSEAGIHGAPKKFRLNWGDGTETGWQTNTTFSHEYVASRVVTARAFARNAHQSSSMPLTFQVGAQPPPAAPSEPVLVPFAQETPAELNALQRFFAHSYASGLAATGLSVLLLVLLFLLVARRKGAAPPPNRYVVERELGRGAYSKTFLARDRILDRPVVLKQSTAPWLLADDARKRFLKEARVLARLRHANVITVYEILADQSPPTLVLEYMEHGSLDVLLKQERRLSLAVTESIAGGMLRGLGHIHEAGIIHRDIKPANILLSQDGTAKVSDLGIARPPKDFEAMTLAATRHQPGSPLYMSPEQARGADVGHRSDLYSAAAVVYEMLTGRHYLGPIEGPEFRLRHRIEKERPDLDGHGIPDRLRTVLEKALSKDPGRRFQSAEDMRWALAEAFQPLPPGASAKRKPNKSPVHLRRRSAGSKAALSSA